MIRPNWQDAATARHAMIAMQFAYLAAADSLTALPSGIRFCPKAMLSAMALRVDNVTELIKAEMIRRADEGDDVPDIPDDKDLNTRIGWGVMIPLNANPREFLRKYEIDFIDDDPGPGHFL